MKQVFSLGSWREFISDKIVPIRNYAGAILDFSNFLKGLRGREILEVLSEYPKLEVIFLGGTNKDGYTENSFAKAIKDLFGAYINVKAYYSYIVQGLEPKVPIEVEKSEIMFAIQAIKEVSDRILKFSEIKSEITNEFINNPDKVLEGFLEFLNLCLNVCVGYNEYTTFCWTIRKITKKYLAHMYPDALKDENFKFLKDFLGLRELFIPNIDDEKIRDSYTVLGFPDYCSIYVIRGRNLGSSKYPRHTLEILTNDLELPKDSQYYGIFSLPHSTDEIYTSCKDVVYLRTKTFSTEQTLGGSLLKLNELIWFIFRMFSSILSQILQDVPNPKYEYLKACGAELEKIGWKEPKFLSEFMGSKDEYYDSRRVGGWINEFVIDGSLIKEGNSIYCVRTNPYSMNTSVYLTSKTLDEPFLILLDNIMPAVCLGTHEIIFGKNDAGNDTFVIMNR